MPRHRMPHRHKNNKRRAQKRHRQHSAQRTRRMASKRKIRIAWHKRRYDFTPRNARQREDQLDAFAALALMRRQGFTARLAAEAEGTTIKKIRKYVGSALRKRGKDIVAKPSDRIRRPPMIALDRKGTYPIVVRGSRAASQMGQYWNAVDDALKGRPSALKKFRGKKIPHNKLKFLTDLKALRRLQDAGVLQNIKEIYWRGRHR